MNDEECEDQSSLLNKNKDTQEVKDDTSGVVCEFDVIDKKQDVGLKRQIGLLGLVAYLIGSIIGSGIFASPRSVAIYSGSSGVMLLVWVAGGALTIMGALIWCELSLTFPNACATDYSYIYEAFGSFTSFITMYILLLTRCASMSMISIVAGDYIMTAIVGSGDSGYSKGIAAAIIGINLLINCFSVKVGKRTQVFFMGTKMIAITMLIVTGLVRIGQGHIDNFKDAFNGSSTSIGDIAFALYGGLYAYGGWNTWSGVTAEAIDPIRNCPLALVIGIPLIIMCYVLVNIAYLTVKTPSQIAESSAIAVVLGKDLYGVMHWTIPALVACSCFSTANGKSFFIGRIIYEASNRNHLPKILGTVHITRHTPIPALIFTSLISWLILIPKASNFRTLMNYVQFFEWTKIAVGIAAMLWMRRSKPHLRRPFKVFIGIPILLFILSLFIVLAPFVRYPAEQGYGVLFLLPSVPLYLAFVKYQILPQKVLEKFDMLTKKIQEVGNLGLPDFAKDKRVESE